MNEYLCARYKKNLDNEIIDISYEDIFEFHKKNIRDKKECEEITKSSYQGENNYHETYENKNIRHAFYREI